MRICKDCGGNQNVGQDRICVECRKCRDQIPPEAPDPDWDAWLKPVIDLYGPVRAVNTCGGFKAEIAYDPTAQAFDEPFRHIGERT